MSSQPNQPNSGLNTLTPPTWLGLASDVVLWLVLLFITALAVTIFIIWPQQAQQQVISLSFRNANEVSRGSLVRMMGTEIGYVDNIHIEKDHVQVVVKTNPGDMRIPPDSTFTVNFTGLAGTKSIEVIPPDKPTSGHEISQGAYFVEEPTSMKDAQKAQIQVAKALQKGAENFSDFFGKKQPIEELQHNIQLADKKVANANRILASANKTTQQIGNNLHNGLTKTNDAIYSFAVSSQEAARVTGTDTFGTDVISTIGRISKTLLNGQKAMATFVQDRHLQRYQTTAHQLDQMFATIGQQITPQQWINVWDKKNQALYTADQFLAKLKDWTNPPKIMRKMDAARPHIQQFNKMVIQFNQQADKAKAQPKIAPKSN